MPFADDARRGHFGTGLQRVDGRIKTFARPLAREHDRRGEMRERMHRRRIGEIVRRHIHRLNGGDGAGIGVGDALLQPRQLGAHRGLIAQTRRHLPHQAGHFRAGLDEPENIVDQQQHVAMLVVPEILGHRQRGVAHAEPAARRLVHLPEHHHHVRQHAGFLHVAVKLLAFATTFADAAKNADALLVPDHVVDHFGEQHRLAHARSAEQSRLAAALQRHEHIDDLDPRLEDLGFGGTPCQRRRGSMDGAPLDICRRRLAVDGVAEHVEHARENSLADRRLQRPARVFHRACRGRGLGWGSARFHARDARRVELKPRWQFPPPARAATSRWAANVHRTVYLRHCRAPRPLPRGSKDWFYCPCNISFGQPLFPALPDDVPESGPRSKATTRSPDPHSFPMPQVHRPKPTANTETAAA